MLNHVLLDEALKEQEENDQIEQLEKRQLVHMQELFQELKTELKQEIRNALQEKGMDKPPEILEESK